MVAKPWERRSSPLPTPVNGDYAILDDIPLARNSAHPMNRRFFLMLLVSASMLAARAGSLFAQVRDEREVKAVWLYRFGQHVAWPDRAAPVADGTFVIGVLGPNPFGVFLDKLVGKEIRKQKIVVRYFASAMDYQPCHILFISPLAGNAAETTPNDRLAALRGVVHKHTLIVGDWPGLAGAGAMINYVINANGLINLEINRRAVQAAQLEIGAALLKLPIVIFVP